MRRARTAQVALAIALGASLGAAQVPADARKDLKAGLPDVREAAVKRAAAAGAAAVPLLLPVLAADKDGRVRDAAFRALESLDDAAGSAALIDAGLGAKDPALRAAAAEVLGAQRALAAAPALAAALGDKDAAVRRAAAAALAPLKHAPALEALIGAVDTAADPVLQSFAVEAVSRIGGAPAQAALERWAGAAADPVRAQALRSLGFHDKAVAGAAVAAALAEPEFRADGPLRLPLLAAIAEARRLHRAEPVAPLIDLLEHPRERAVNLAYDALRALTGMELECRSAAWREWWQHHGATFRVPGGESAIARSTRSQARFLGAPIASDRVVFVIDYSGSMRDAAGGGRAKIDVARDALREALEALPKGAAFTVVAFGEQVRLFAPELVPVSPASVEDAAKFLKGAAPAGKTNVYDALERALAVPGADTVVLLSDGAPSCGRYESFSRIRWHVAAENRARGVAISAVALETGEHARGFLKELAEENGGVYVEK